MAAEHPYVTVEHEISLSGAALVDLMQAVFARGLPFVFRARGWSMSPFIRDLDTLHLQPLGSTPPRLGDVVAFVHPATGKLVVHRVIARRGQSFHIQGDAFLPEANHPQGASFPHRDTLPVGDAPLQGNALAQGASVPQGANHPNGTHQLQGSPSRKEGPFPSTSGGLIPFENLLGRVTRVERRGRRVWPAVGPERSLIALLSRWGLLSALVGLVRGLVRGVQPGSRPQAGAP